MMVPQDFLITIAQEYGVSDSEMRALSEAIEGNSPTVIAQKFGTRPEVIRNQLGGVYKKFQIQGAGPGKLAKLQQILMSRYQAQQGNEYLVSQIPRLETSDNQKPRQDWAEAPDISGFTGRTAELTQLSQWITCDHCRSIGIIGNSGIGKTSLTAKLIQTLAPEFEFVFWQSLRYAPSIKDSLGRIIQFLSGRAATHLIEEEHYRITVLLDYLMNHRCLLVFDGFETVLQSGELAGHYREGYEMYGELLTRFTETNHSSCVLLTSQEKPRELEPFEGQQRSVRTFQLSGLSTKDAKTILQSQDLGDTAHWDKLIQSYQGNPLELRIAATMIQDLFNGKVGDFLKRSTFVFGGIRTLLGQQFDRLSEIEKDILYWLVVEQEALLEDLQKSFWLPLPQTHLLEALDSLKRRSLLETKADTKGTLFYLQPVILEYGANQFTEQVCIEVKQFATRTDGKQIQLMRSHALTPHLQKSEKMNQATVNSLVNITRDRLIVDFRNITKLEDCLNQMLKLLGNEPESRVGYAIENIRALLKAMNSF